MIRGRKQINTTTVSNIQKVKYQLLDAKYIIYTLIELEEVASIIVAETNYIVTDVQIKDNVFTNLKHPISG